VNTSGTMEKVSRAALNMSGMGGPHKGTGTRPHGGPKKKPMGKKSKMAAALKGAFSGNQAGAGY
jgi:hypothetical protein